MESNESWAIHCWNTQFSISYIRSWTFEVFKRLPFNDWQFASTSLCVCVCPISSYLRIRFAWLLLSCVVSASKFTCHCAVCRSIPNTTICCCFLVRINAQTHTAIQCHLFWTAHCRVSVDGSISDSHLLQFCCYITNCQWISLFPFLFSEYVLKLRSLCASSTSCAARLELVCFSQHTLFKYLAPWYSGLMAQLDSDLFNDYCALRARVYHNIAWHSWT